MLSIHWFWRVFCAEPATTSAANALRPVRRLAAVERVAACRDAVEIGGPHPQIDVARSDDLVDDAEPLGIRGDGAPTQIGMRDIGFGVQREEFQIVVLETEKFAPARALHPEPAVFADSAVA